VTASTGGSEGTSSVGRIDIVSGIFALNSPHSGIGFGWSTAVENVTIEGGVFDCTGVTGSACFSGNKVRVGNGSTIVTTGKPTFVSGSAWEISDAVDLFVEYTLNSTREDNITGHRFLHVGSFALPADGAYAVEIARVDGTQKSEGAPIRALFIDWPEIQSFGFSVDSPGNYSILFNGPVGGFVGYLEHDGIQSFGADVRGDNFFSTVGYVSLPPTVPQTPVPTGTPVATGVGPVPTATPVATGVGPLPPATTPVATEGPGSTGTPTPTPTPGSGNSSRGPTLTAVFIVIPCVVAIGVGIGVCVFLRRRKGGKLQVFQQRLLGPNAESWTGSSVGA
jgi:hypothetical protein